MHKKIAAILAAFLIAATNSAAIVGSADVEMAAFSGTEHITEPDVKPEKTKDVKTYGKLQYVVEDDNSITIVGCDEDTTWIKLTKNLNGKPIKKIEKNAFKNHTKLTQVTLAEGLEEIGAKAFYNTGITEIAIPATVKAVRRSALANCKSLEKAYAYTYKDVSVKLGDDVFAKTKATLYCSQGSDYVKYAQKNDIKYAIAAKYEKEKPVEKAEPEETQESESSNTQNVRVKYIKGCPEDLEDLGYSWHEEDDEYVFDRSGMRITKSDYIILCNCVANEYGACWVPTWEKALVCEVVYNLYYIEGRESLYDCITVPNRFAGSWAYKDLDHFSSKVDNDVILAVHTYLSFPEYFNEGYTQFRGDGYWNWFW